MAEETVLIRFKGEDEASRVATDVQSKLDDVGTAAGKAGDSFTSMGGVMSGVLQGVGQAIGNFAMNLGGQLLTGVTDFFKSSIEEASQWDTAMNQTQSVVASTGQAAGFTAEQLGDMASAMSASSSMSLFSDDAILGAENVLATFTNIKGVSFEGATQAVLDISQALGTDLQGSAIQVGKALNDPIAGVTALSRVGVSFTDQQKALIKAMTETGDVAGAQKLILNELATEFGGSASGAVDTFAGQQVVLSEQFNDMKQTIGASLMPILSQLTGAFSDKLMPIIGDLVDNISYFLDSFTGEQIKGFTDQIGNFATIAEGAFYQAIDGVKGFFDLLTNSTGFDATVATFQSVIDAIVNIGTAIASTGPTFSDSLSKIMTFVNLLVEDIGSNLQPIITMLGDKFATLAPILADIGNQIITAFTSPAVTSALTAITDMVGGAVLTVLTDLMNLIIKLAQSAAANLPALLNAIAPIGTALQNLVNTAMPIIMQLYEGFKDWLGSPQVQAVISQLVATLTSFGSMLRDIVLGAVNGVTAGIKLFAEYWPVMWTYIEPVVNLILGIVQKLLTYLQYVFLAVKAAIDGNWTVAWEILKAVASDALDSLYKYISGIGDKIKEWIGLLATKASEIGTNMMSGIADGIKSGASWIRDALTAAVTAAWNAATGWLSGASSTTSQEGGNPPPPPTGRSGRLAENLNGSNVTYNFVANYAGAQSESSLISDVQALMALNGGAL